MKNCPKCGFVLSVTPKGLQCLQCSHVAQAMNAALDPLDGSDMVWLVTQGEFDDYEIIYVMDSEEAAARHVKWWNAYWDYHGTMIRRVETHEVLTEAPKMDRSDLSMTLNRIG